LTKPDGTPIAIPGLWYLTFGGGTPQTGLTKQLYFDAGPSLEQGTGHGLFGRIIAAGQGDGPGSSADSAASVAGPLSTAPGPAQTTLARGQGPMSTVQVPLAQTPLPLIDDAPLNADPQGTSVASQPSGLQPTAADVTRSSGGAQTASRSTSAVKPILQTGNTETIDDVLDGLTVGLANGPDEFPAK
jgi:hypothetical protein